MIFIVSLVAFIGLQAAILFSAAYFYKKKQKVLGFVATHFLILIFLAIWKFDGKEDFLMLAVLQFALSFSYSVHIFSKEKSWPGMS
jgi:hypothetical protein